MRIESQWQAYADEFVRNRDASCAKWNEVLDLQASIHAKFPKSFGLQKLFDSDAPFIELSPFAGYQERLGPTSAGGGWFVGLGRVNKVSCIAIALTQGESGSSVGFKKITRALELCLRFRLPCSVILSGEPIVLSASSLELEKVLALQAQMAAENIPLWLATPNGQWPRQPIFHAGLATAILNVSGDDSDFSELRARIKSQHRADFSVSKGRHWMEPFYSTEEMFGVIPEQVKKPYPVQEILARITDGSEFEEFKSDYESQTVCGRGSIFGRYCGFIGNNGPITAKGAGKAAQFVELCEQSRTPLVFLHNTTGFMVGTEAERSGIIRQGSKMIQAVANASVAKISIIVGGSFGAGNYAMCGRGFDPDFLFSWPSARTAVMGGEQAGKVLRIVAEEKARREGQVPDESKLQLMETQTRKQLDASSTAIFGSSQMWDDGIIDPRDTRKILGLVLELVAEMEQKCLSEF